MSRLAEYFQGVAVKRLSEVEANTAVSNQHEFQGISRMRNMFGEARITRMPTDILYLGEDEAETIRDTTLITWYDSRENQPLRSAEYRAYFTGNQVMEKAQAGDLLFVTRKRDGNLMIVVVRQGSTFERQVLWLFGITGDEGTRVEINEISGESDRNIGYAESTVLETLGIEPEAEPEASSWLDRIIERFGESFPTTRLFSEFARETATAPSPAEDPDGAIMAWLGQEEMLFRTLERHIVEERLETPFQTVDEFISYSLSVQNRRKSRAGSSLEHHLRQVFNSQTLRFSEQQITEQNSKPDFLFPNINCYRDTQFTPGLLTMLGAKSSCKERWNQVLAEAERIPNKHLFTLEAAISPRQTDKMQEKNLQLVLPAALHESYLPAQQNWLMNLDNFISMVRDRQRQAGL